MVERVKEELLGVWVEKEKEKGVDRGCNLCKERDAPTWIATGPSTRTAVPLLLVMFTL